MVDSNASGATRVALLEPIRGLAALAVVAHHIEQVKALLGIPNEWTNPVVQSLGNAGVDLFFCLSGFVITRSALLQIRQTGKFLIGRFLARRALRILPLYFLAVGFAFSGLPSRLIGLGGAVTELLQTMLQQRDDNYSAVLQLYLAGLPNVALLEYPTVPFVSQLWSVGAELQFYAAWGIFLYAVQNVWTAALLAIVIKVYLPTIISFATTASGISSDALGATFVQHILGTIHGDYLLAGIAGAGLLGVSGGLRQTYSAPAALPAIIFSMVVAFLMFRHAIPQTQYVAPLVAGGLVTLPAVFRGGQASRVATFLGRISFSIYVWHLWVIGCVMIFVERTMGFASWGISSDTYAYVLTAGLTIGVAHLSFRWIERPFLALAGRFEV